MEKVVGEQDLALQQHFPYKSSKFSENSNCHVNFLFNSRGLKLGHFGKNFLRKMWSCDPSYKGSIALMRVVLKKTVVGD